MECAEAARLLGIAWVGSGLYPDPASQDSFRRVATELATISEPLDFEPGPEELRCRRIPLGDLGPALRRFTATAFAHRVSVIRLHPGFSPEHLAIFLQLVAVDPSALDRIGGLAAAIRGRDLEGIEVALQSSLVESSPSVASSDALAVSMLLRDFAEVPPDLGSSTYVDQFTDVVENNPELVANYLEAFTRLEKPVQEAIIARLMGESARELQEIFLNQLAGHELAELGSSLGPQAASFLSDYVEYSTGHRGVEAESAVLDPDSLLTFRTQVAARVNSRLQELDVTGFSRTFEMPPMAEWSLAAQEVLRGLFAVEQRPDKLERAARAWGRLVIGAIRRGSFAEGLGWYLSGSGLRDVSDQVWRSEHDRIADAAIPNVVLGAASGGEPSLELLGWLAPGHGAAVVMAMEPEEMEGKREVIASNLMSWLDGDVEPLLDALPALDRSVPTVLAVLGRSGADVGSDERVRALTKAPRAEVRLLALELCIDSLPFEELGPLLTDAAGQVRRQAYRRLAAEGSRQSIDMLAKALESASDEERLAIASALARSTEGISYLRSLASGWRTKLTARGRADQALVSKVLRR